MRILWLKTELLHPVDKGGKIRTYHMLKELKRDHRITYLTLDDGQAAEDAAVRAEEYCDELVRIPHRTRAKFSAGFYVELAANLFSPLPYFMKKYESAQMRREVERRTNSGEFDVLVCDFLVPYINMPARVSDAATVLFQHNVEAMIWRRHYEVQRHPLKKAYLYGQWVKTRRYERHACRRFDRVVAVSREDGETMEREYGLREVPDVPTGVDTEFFRPRGQVARDAHNLVFTGSMDWLPNEDAIRFFTSEVMPLVKREVPDVTLTVVGRNPYPGLVELSRRDPSVTVTGRVEDVRPYMERAAAYVVPIRVGGGTRLKIYEAMAMEKPVVSTTVGAEGLPLADGEELLLADTPAAFAASVVRVLRDAELARRLGASAAAKVRERFGWARVAAAFAEECERAIEHRRAAAQDAERARLLTSS
ncbi:MAG TPA: glycosyltransferase [Pyrinomonadaceae bacterium]|nr:glycosyltransferase [Pyrinomonadaceae bacterium]